MIQISNATKRFDQKVAISSLSLDIDTGVIGLVGQNGAGKSTLLRMIAGVYQVDEGKILVDSFLSTSKESKELVFFLPDDFQPGVQGAERAVEVPHLLFLKECAFDANSLDGRPQVEEVLWRCISQFGKYETELVDLSLQSTYQAGFSLKSHGKLNRG